MGNTPPQRNGSVNYNAAQPAPVTKIVERNDPKLRNNAIERIGFALTPGLADVNVKGDWRIPERKFGTAVFRQNVGRNGQNIVYKHFVAEEEWQSAKIVFNPERAPTSNIRRSRTGSGHYVANIRFSAHYVDEYRRYSDFHNNYPNSDEYLEYRDILFNTSMVTPISGITDTEEYYNVLEFWAYPNGEFYAIPITNNCTGTYLQFQPYPQEYGNPQTYKPTIKPGQTKLTSPNKQKTNSNKGKSSSPPLEKYVFLAYQNNTFLITLPNSIVRIGRDGQYVEKNLGIGTYVCNRETFNITDGRINNEGNRCELYQEINLDETDILLNYPDPLIPPYAQQGESKPWLRYSSYNSVPTTLHGNSNTTGQFFGATNWVWPKYYRFYYLASDMQCAISKEPYKIQNGVKVLLFKNGTTLLPNKIDLVRTDLVPENQREQSEDIYVTCNPGALDPNGNTFLTSMFNYCGTGSRSFYKDSKYRQYQNEDRTDEEGNKLGEATLERWDSKICQNYSKKNISNNLVNTAQNFQEWCSHIENWTKNGNCFNIANAVNELNQNVVNTTIQQLCYGPNLDEPMCKKFCFGMNTSNLNCASQLAKYCGQLIRDEITRVDPILNFERTDNKQKVEVYQGGNEPNLYPNLEKTDDGLLLNYSNNAVNRAASAVFADHPQCPCFMPTWVYSHYYNSLVQDFPPSPELNSFLLTVYNLPVCTYGPCANNPQFFPRTYPGTNIIDSNVKLGSNLKAFECPSNYYLRRVESLGNNQNDLANSSLQTVLTCARNIFGPIGNQLALPRCPIGYHIRQNSAEKVLCQSNSNFKYYCSPHINGDPIVGNQYCEPDDKATDFENISHTYDSPGGPITVVTQCPTQAVCLQNAVVNIDGLGQNVVVNIESDITIRQTCESVLSSFSLFTDTNLVTPLIPQNNISFYDIVNGLDQEGKGFLTVQCQRARGNPAIPPPIVTFYGYFTIISGQCQLIVTKILNGDLPNKYVEQIGNLATHPIIGKWVAPNTRITSYIDNPPNAPFLPLAFVVSGQTTALGNASNPLLLFLQASAPDVVPINDYPFYYEPGAYETPIRYKIGDGVHIYESNFWQNYETGPTKFTGTISYSQAYNQWICTVSGVNKLGPITPGKLQAINGVKAETELVECLDAGLDGNGARAFYTTGSIWSIKSLEPYTQTVGPVIMFLTTKCVKRYITGLVAQVFSNGNLTIECINTNESQNQYLWSNSANDLRSVNSSGQLANCLTIIKDESVTLPSGDYTNQDTYYKKYYKNYKGVQHTPYFDNKKMTYQSSTPTLVVILLIVGLVAGGLLLFYMIRQKNHLMKQSIIHTDEINM